MKKLLTSLILVVLAQLSFGQSDVLVQKRGLYLGLGAGTWFADNENKILGTPLNLSALMEARYEVQGLGLALEMVGLSQSSNREPVVVKHGDSVVSSKSFHGMTLSLLYNRQFYESRRFALEGICGLGYGDLSYYNPDAQTDVSKSSFLVNPGFSMRFVSPDDRFLKMSFQYAIANYDLGDGLSTPLRGTNFTLNLVIGAVSH